MSLFLRKADINNAEIILQWRNDSLTRNYSFTKELIDLDTHLKWYEGKLLDESCFMYILMDGTEKVGQIRIDKVNDIGEISYTIGPDKRNMGYGKKIIQLSENIISSDIKALTGLVENSNKPSQKCFKYNNFAEFFGRGIICYIKVL